MLPFSVSIVGSLSVLSTWEIDQEVAGDAKVSSHSHLQ